MSLDDCFWVGGERAPLHPYLIRALLVIVNRRKRKPIHFRSRPLWEQPVYVMLKRDGTYLCACCGLENGSLVVHPYSNEFIGQLTFVITMTPRLWDKSRRSPENYDQCCQFFGHWAKFELLALHLKTVGESQR